ncbi:translation initiation factor IF-3 [Cellulomonas edaphi]|uniref:Translation initiation factor IF-3 n=1 Tax=Cellulomonas edaphi TaxID=3053468 RepID=A0ABT7S8P6_9CELL|nr:translation initiation factor IF-3 [Cellulomons edaphi]MDM7831983.1 translation initiation factor IF-3 [Cellulomons edaphi]
MSPETTTEEHHISEPRINDRIRVAEVRLVGPNGEQVGIVRVEDALRLAQDADLDLVEVAPEARPPVCKIMDYGKYKYEADMKAREARRNQTNTVLKEIRFRLKIDPHDYGTKKGHVERFLKAGDKVKVMIMFRGREQSRPEMGVRLLQRLADDVTELGFIESMPKQDGRNMVMVLGPTKKKADQKLEQRRAAQAAAAREENAAKAAAKAAQADEAPADQAAAVEAPVTEAAAVEAPAAEAAPAAAPVEEAPADAAEAPAKATPKAAPKAAAPKAAPKAAAPEAAESSAAATPAPAPRPATPRPAAPRPAAPRPAAARPAATTATKPAPRPAPKPRATPSDPTA